MASKKTTSKSRTTTRASAGTARARASAKKSAAKAKSSSISTQELIDFNNMRAAVEGAQTAMMMVDRNFVVTYVNKRTMELFRTYESDFRKLWPTFNPNAMIGQCIDMFHRNPRHQRDMLADPSKLPHKADIRVGDFAFSLQVSAQMDMAGNYIGNLLEWADVTKQRQLEALDAAMNRSQAMLEMSLDGTIIHANDNFLNTTGYLLNEIVGKNYSMFVDPHASSAEGYRTFWNDLRAGKPNSGEYQCVGKGGKVVWLQAAFNPILDQRGSAIKISMTAVEITAAKLRNADFEGQISAIHKSQAVIEFNLDGTIRTANENFLNAMGYTLAEIQGKHHSMFVEPTYGASPEYRKFWDDLRSGLSHVSQFSRLGKGGKAVWIQASYNVILDPSGRPLKIVKFANDITKSVLEQQANERAERDRLEQERRFAEEQQAKVEAVLEIVNAIANGDFNIEVPDLGNDAIGQVASALAKAVVSVRTTLLEVQDVAGTVNLAAGELTSASRESAPALKRRLATWKRLLPASKKSLRPLNRTATTRSKLANWPPVRAMWLRRAEPWWAMPSKRWLRLMNRPRRLLTSLPRSTKSRFKPTCWRSTRPSRQLEPASRGEALRSSRLKCAIWPNAVPAPPRRSSR